MESKYYAAFRRWLYTPNHPLTWWARIPRAYIYIIYVYNIFIYIYIHLLGAAFSIPEGGDFTRGDGTGGESIYGSKWGHHRKNGKKLTENHMDCPCMEKQLTKKHRLAKTFLLRICMYLFLFKIGYDKPIQYRGFHCEVSVPSWYISYPSLKPQTFKSEVHLDDPNAILFPKAGQPTPPKRTKSRRNEVLIAGLKGKQWVFKTLQRPESPTLVTGASNVSRSFG